MSDDIDIATFVTDTVDQSRRERGWVDPTDAEELRAALAFRTGQLQAARRHADEYQAEAAWLRGILESEGYNTQAMYAGRELASPGTPKASEHYPASGHEGAEGDRSHGRDRVGGAEVGPSAGPSPANEGRAGAPVSPQAGGVDAPASHPTLAAGAQGAGESGVGSRFNSGPPVPLDYLLWSNKHSAWWRPASCGYTSIRAEAGRYSEEEAVARVLRSAQCGRVEEVTLMVVAPPLCPAGEHLWGRAVGLHPARRVRCQRCGDTTSVPWVDP